MTAPIVTADHLTRTYHVGASMFSKGQDLHALSETSFTLAPGRTLAVVGESGCGKSTLARVVTMIEPPTAGALNIDGIDVAKATNAERVQLRSTVQIVFQNPFGSLNPRQKIGKILEEPLLINRRDIPARAREERARKMLTQVGLRPEHYDRYPHMFSGGQRQRIAVARALMMDPRVLVLDEPVSALDLSIQGQILNLLVELQDRLNLAYLFISHDLSVVKHMANDVMVMYLGRVVEYGSKEEIFGNPRHPYTRALLSATPVADPEAPRKRIKLEGELPSPLNVPPGCAFHARCRFATEICKKDRPELRKVGGQLTACHHAETVAD